MNFESQGEASCRYIRIKLSSYYFNHLSKNAIKGGFYNKGLSSLTSTTDPYESGIKRKENGQGLVSKQPAATKDSKRGILQDSQIFIRFSHNRVSHRYKRTFFLKPREPIKP